MQAKEENPDFLKKQIITYLGNKRKIITHIDDVVSDIRADIGRDLVTLDLFSGSGIVARALKKHSAISIANDLEGYTLTANKCFLTDYDKDMLTHVSTIADNLSTEYAMGARTYNGFISKMYAPKDDKDVQLGERCFYTTDNAQRIDFFRSEIEKLPEDEKTLLLAPLLAESSVHTNTVGIFKSFLKDRNTKIGSFGGTTKDALSRICSPILLQPPVRSVFTSEVMFFQEDAVALSQSDKMPEIDVAYIDPPYNQHSYGSNYFMLNVINEYARPENVSKVSGIPADWNRSDFYVKSRALESLETIVSNLNARYIILSFSSDGFFEFNELENMMGKYGHLEMKDVVYTRYRTPTYRAKKDSSGKVETKNTERLFILKKK